MADTETKGPKTKPQKGGRKGGVLFPKINLEQAIGYAKKLVAKTHTGAQGEKTILPGVFGNSGPVGKIRASALKQYGLLDGSVAAYKATQLAKDIDAALEADLPQLLQRAFLKAKIFKEIFDTFHGDTVSKARIEQRARGLDVHPTSAEECAQLFIESVITAKLGKGDSNSLVLVKAGEVVPAGEAASGEDGAEADEPEGEVADARGNPAIVQRLEKPAVTLALTVDATSDPDKLEKQLKLLRQYGVI